MGNDGGSIAKRIDLVKEKSKEVKKDTVAINQNRSKHCAISNAKLHIPLVVCRLGYLYNKEALLNCLINKTMPSTFSHISKLKDVKDVQATENNNHHSQYPLICPLTGLEFNGLSRFLVLWRCGCMISEKALKASPTPICPMCGTAYKPWEITLLNLSPEEIEVKRVLLHEEKMQALAEKKEKVEKVVVKDDAVLLGKRDLKDIESYIIPEHLSKKIAKGGTEASKAPENILDKLAAAGNSSLKKSKPVFTIDYEELFHKDSKVEDAKGLFFRNCRFGIR